MRGKPEKFAEHYNQATLFWNSQSDVEKAAHHRAFRFELTKVQTVAVRERVVAQLRNCRGGACAGRGGWTRADRCRIRCPSCSSAHLAAEVEASGALSLFASVPGSWESARRRIAMLVADGVKGKP